MGNVVIRSGKKEDIQAVYNLIVELAKFENAPEQVKNNVESLLKDSFGASPTFEFIVAEKDHEIVGTAIYFVMYSTWKGNCIYLDDLIVSEKSRRLGIGKKLFDQLIKITKDRGMAELHWQVLDWNTSAINFYKKYDAKFDSEWIDCKLDTSQLQFIKL